MSRRRGLCVAAITFVAACTVEAGHATHASAAGYRARACGFDLDRDGTAGEAEDCTVLCRAALVDGRVSGAREREVYVDCGGAGDADAGVLDESCGRDGERPCKTLALGITRAGEGASVCFRGRCTTAENVELASGRAGTYERARRGNQKRATSLPREPFVVSGWDADRDGVYPPLDGDDTSLLDGGPAKLCRAFSLAGASWVELAHFGARDYGHPTVACGDDGGFWTSTGGTGNDAFYAHDLELERISFGLGVNTPKHKVWNVLGSQDLDDFTWENIRCVACGGWHFRGGQGKDPRRLSERWLIQDYELVAHAAGRGGDGGTRIIEVWGGLVGLQIVDGKFDANVRAYEPGKANAGINPGACTRDWWIAGNELIDFRTHVTLGTDEYNGACAGLGRPMDEIAIHRNVFRSPNAARHRWASTVILAEDVGRSERETTGTLDIVNNVMTMRGGRQRGAVILDHGHHGRCEAGASKTRIVHNTIDVTPTDREGAIDLGGRGRAPCEPADYEVRNNIVVGRGHVARCLDVGISAPRVRFVAGHNVYDRRCGWAWDARPHGTLERWREASGTDAGAVHGCDGGEPAFVDAEGGDFHLSPTDTCARDRAVPSEGVVVDLDGDPRPQGTHADIGADEVRVSQ